MKRTLHYFRFLALPVFACAVLFDVQAIADDLAEAPLRVELKDASQLVTSQKMRRETARTVSCLEDLHYLRMPLAEIDTREFISEYMRNLDIRKLFFTANDVQHYQDAYAGSIELLLKGGVLLPANAIYHETFVPRANERLEWIRARMNLPFDMEADETFAPNRSKESWARNAAEADQLWEGLLKYEIIARLLDCGEDDGTFEANLEKAKAEVLKRYERVIANMTKNNAEEIQEVFLNSLCGMYDPHSSFLLDDRMEDFDISIRNSLVGIGTTLYEEDGYCHVSDLVPGGPAEKSKGISLGDKIVGVGQGDGEIVEIIGGKFRDTIRMIRGKAGTKVRLQVESKDGTNSKVLTLVREEIRLTSKLAKAKIYEMEDGEKTVPVGVIELLSFYGGQKNDLGGTSKDVEELIEKLKRRNVSGIVLDLRKNGGGFLKEAVNLAGLFIRTGPVLQASNSQKEINVWRDEDPKVVWDGPLVVLVSRLSASASEIFAGALQNYERAVVVGDENTYGKGTVQSPLDLSFFNKALEHSVKITVEKWYLPNGESIQVNGVRSDIVLPSLWSHMDLGEDKKDYVLPWDEIEPVSIRAGFGYGSGESGGELLAELRKRSEARRSELPEFVFLSDRIEWLKKRSMSAEYSLSYALRKEAMREDEAFTESMNSRLKILSKNSYRNEEVLLDSVIAKNAQSPKTAITHVKLAEGLVPGALMSAMNYLHDAAAGSADKSEKDETGDMPEFDIHLREALRVVQDWIEISRKFKKELI